MANLFIKWEFWSFLLLLSILQSARGTLNSPYLEAIPDNAPEEVTVTLMGSAPDEYVNITIKEEVMKEPNFFLGKILYTGGEATAIRLQSVHPTMPVEICLSEDNTTAYIELTKKLDAEEPPEQVALGFFLRQDSSAIAIYVTIVDINDNKPELKINCSNPMELKEDAFQKTPGDKICQFDATDKDALDAGQLRFTFKDMIGGGTNVFAFDQRNETSGTVIMTLNDTLDYMENPMYRFNILVHDSNETSKDEMILTINIQDVPNLPPVWRIFKPLVEVKEFNPENPNEGSDKGYVITTVSATDGDIQVKSNITYSITFPDHAGMERYIEIDEDTGEIKVRDPIIDTDIKIIAPDLIVTANITATEVNEPKWDADDYPNLNTTQEMQITIKDLNTHAPEFCVSDEDCDDTLEWEIILTDEETVGVLTLDKNLCVRDLDPTPQNSTFTVELVPFDVDHGYVIEALDINPKSGTGLTNFTISAKALDYEDDAGFELDDNEGKWWKLDDDGIPQPKKVKFNITATDTNNSTKSATTVVTLTVRDINDNTPIHSFDAADEEYNFVICENAPRGYFIKNIELQSDDVCLKPVHTPPFDEDDAEIIHATDADISHKYGQNSVILEWLGSKALPLTLNSTTGTMMVNKENAFDYERLPEEVYTVLAVDENNNSSSTTKRRANAVVNIKVLDVNDTPLELRLSSGRVSIKENTTEEKFEVEILAEDKDVTGCIVYSLQIESVNNEELDEEIKTWFKITPNDDDSKPCYRVRNATIELGTGSVDREGGGIRDVDRVDVLVTATDKNTFSGASYQTVRLTIEIVDINDNPPEFEDFDPTAPILFTETNFENKTDTESPTKREITSFRATDKDIDTVFHFTLDSPHADMLKWVVLEPLANGRAVLRRKQDETIDREEQIDDKDMDHMNFTISVSDSDNKHTTSIDIVVTIEDINDNTPQYTTLGKEYNVTELEAGDVVTFEATDSDKADQYGKVSYWLQSNYGGRFNLDLNTGVLSVTTNTNWTEQQNYNLTIEFIDNYRPESDTQSNRNQTVITVFVIDVNNHPPTFLTPQDTILSKIFEKEFHNGSKFNEMIQIKDLDDPDRGNGDFKIEILTVDCSNEKVVDPKSFFLVELLVSDAAANEKNASIIATKSFEGSWGIYTICFLAEDLPNPERDPPESSKSSTCCYKIDVMNMNLNEPEFLYPTDNTTKIFISLQHEIGAPLRNYRGGDLVPYISTQDADYDPTTGNGNVTCTLESSEDIVKEYFELSHTSVVHGVFNYSIQLLKQLVNTTTEFRLHITAVDKPKDDEPRSVTTVITIGAINGTNAPPLFDEETLHEFRILENRNGFLDIPDALDLEEEDIFYIIAGYDAFSMYNEGSTGNVSHFNIAKSPEGSKTLYRLEIIKLDREVVNWHRLVVYASNSANLKEEEKCEPTAFDPKDKRYMLVNITVEDEIDYPPEFLGGEDIISGGVSSFRNKIDDLILEIRTQDLDLDDPTTYTLGPITAFNDDKTLQTVAASAFKVEKGSVVNETTTARLIIRFQPQPNMKGYFSFNVTATDTAAPNQLFATRECKIYIVTEKNVVKIKFFAELSVVEDKRERVAEILTEAFEDRCNIDSIYSDEQPSSTIVETHFIDLNQNLPLEGIAVAGRQYNAAMFAKLTTLLSAEGLSLVSQNAIDGGASDSESSSENLITYLLVAGVAIVGVILVIVSVTCFFNNRSLTRRVRALTATTFGSQQSGLNRAGATTLDLPNTNQHAIEGSNPMWTTKNEKNIPDFDTESIGSGGSVLIGAEDEDYFKNHGTSLGNRNPLFNMNNEDNGSMSFGSDDGYTTNDVSANEFGKPPSFYDPNAADEPSEFLDVPMPNVSRRNPLMNMDLHMDDSDS